MRSIRKLKTTLREVDKSKYPELSNYTKDDIWRDIGPGGLYLVSLLAKELSLRPIAQSEQESYAGQVHNGVYVEARPIPSFYLPLYKN